jgi:A/G-specific adenine glycosylase
MRKQFTQKLFRWYNQYKRNLPWIGSNNPYEVWLSEVILQQTRVEQGLAYFVKFLKKYPTVAHLARASEDDVLKMWEGLGYYSRARNMHSTAKRIVNEFDSVFPTTFESLIQLKGIGVYTAQAILSYAYKQPYAVVDGNVLRILSRFYGIREPIDSNLGKTTIQQKADALLDTAAPDKFNQAMMDFGSLVCTPQRPDCANCPVQKLCTAYAEDNVAKYPVKSKKTKKQHRYFHFFVLRDGKQVLIEQRKGSDIWKNLYQFPVIETSKASNLSELMELPDYKAFKIKKPLKIIETDIFKQQLTHRTLHCRFYIFDLKSLHGISCNEAVAVPFSALKMYAFPGVIRDFLNFNEYF